MASTQEHLAQLIACDEYTAARELALRLIGRDPLRPQPWESLAWIDYALGDLTSCLASLEEATLLAPLSDKSRILVAVVHARSGRAELAVELLSHVLESGRRLDPEVRLLAASAYATVGRHDLALRCCRRAAQDDPSLGEAYHLASRSGAAVGLPDHTVESLARRAVQLAPDSAAYRLALASLLVETDREVEAGRLVSNFTLADIRAIGCLHCVELLVELYESAHDWRRVVVCREQILHLEVTGGTKAAE